MQNSRVDREDDDLARPVRFVTDVQRFAWFLGCDRIDVDFEPAFFFVGRERDDAVTQRADKDFFGVERPDECDVDVTAAFEIFRDANVLDAAGAACLEPLPGVNLVALDRDQAVTAVRRGDADRDLVAAVVLGAIELYLKLGILLQ